MRLEPIHIEDNEEDVEPRFGKPGWVDYWVKRTERDESDPDRLELSIAHGDFLHDEYGLPR